jgi:hypothetical protein
LDNPVSFDTTESGSFSNAFLRREIAQRDICGEIGEILTMAKTEKHKKHAAALENTTK